MKMIRNVRLIQEYNFYNKINGFMYFLIKLPILGKWISQKIYKKILKLVGALSFISIIFTFISKIFTKFIYYGVLIFLFSIDGFFNNSIVESNIILNLLTLLTIIGFMKDAFNYYDANHKTYYFIRNFKMKPKDYFLSTYIFDYLVFIVTYTFVMNIFFNIKNIDLSYINIFAFVLFATSLRLLASVLVLKLNLKGKILNRAFNTTLTLYFVSALAIIYIGANLEDSIFLNLEFLYNPIFIILATFIIIISLKIAFNQNNFDEIIYPRLTKDVLFSTDNVNVTFAGVKLKEDGIILDDKDFSQYFSQYSGIEYINRIFFYRNDKMYKKKTRKAFIIKCLIYIGLAIAIFVVPVENSDIEFFKSKFLTLLYFSAYYMYSGDFFIKYCFYNMDYNLMKSNFYRKPQYILESMKFRFVKLLKNQMIPFICMLIMIFAINIRFEFEIKMLLMYLFVGTIGMLFFSLHYLFAYYIIQPFTKDLEIKNPLYSGITYIMFIILYSTWSSKNSLYVLIALIILSILYIIFGFIGLKYLAPKRFKLR